MHLKLWFWKTRRGFSSPSLVLMLNLQRILRYFNCWFSLVLVKDTQSVWKLTYFWISLGTWIFSFAVIDSNAFLHFPVHYFLQTWLCPRGFTLFPLYLLFQTLLLSVCQVHVSWCSSSDEQPPRKHQCLLCPHHHDHHNHCLSFGSIRRLKLWGEKQSISFL